jgi:hypothetical protein
MNDRTGRVTNHLRFTDQGSLIKEFNCYPCENWDFGDARFINILQY